MKKKVFISHSKEDKNIADFICNSLERENVGCWIAPRDIPYGDDWAGDISQAISQSKLFLFLFSENSNKSRQCPKEVNLADNAGVPIICVAIDKAEMNPTLKYHLSLVQGMYLNTSDLSSYIDNIITSVKLKLDNPIESATSNLDKELEKNFNKIFGNTDKKDEVSQNEFQQILDKKITQYHISEFEKLNHSGKSNSKTRFSECDFDEYGNLIEFEQNHGIHTLKGMHFSMIENSGNITVVYQVFENYDVSDFTCFYSSERLDSMFEKTGDGKIKTTYFVDFLEEYVQLIFITFNKNENHAIVNSGVMNPVEGKIRLSKDPSIIHFDSMKNDGKINEFEYSKDSVYIILDPETGEELPKRTIIDAQGNIKTVVDLIAHKSYFSFCVMDTETNKNRISMDAEDVGDFFMRGLKGFPKNTYNALVWYEKAKTKEAYKKMADIFMEDPVFKDEELAVQYAQKYLELQEKTE